MIMTTANGVIEQQNAESHDAEKNIFAEPRNDDDGRAGDDDDRVAATTIRANKHTSSRARTTSRGATSATSMAG